MNNSFGQFLKVKLIYDYLFVYLNMDSNKYHEFQVEALDLTINLLPVEDGISPESFLRYYFKE